MATLRSLSVRSDHTSLGALPSLPFSSAFRVLFCLSVHLLQNPSMTSPYSVLVTGANRGIGLGLVQQLLKNDKIQKIFAGARQPDKATDLNAIKDPRLHVIQLDVQSDGSLVKAVEYVDKEVGEKGLTLLLCNAGVYSNYPVEGDKNRSEILRVLDTNVAGPLLLSQHFLPLLRRASDFNSSLPVGVNRAAIVNISSGMGSIGDNTSGSGGVNGIVYRASKSALNQLTKTLGIDWAPYGIFTVALCPGWVQTDMGGPRAAITAEQSTAAIIASISKHGKEQSGGFFNRNGDPMII